MSATHSFRPHLPRGYLLFALIAAGMLLGACATTQQTPHADPALVSQRRAFKRQATELRALQQRVAELEFRFLEKEAQVTELREKLDEAIQEVVRAKAKLQSVESKAEAASTIAEAEIALKAVRAAAAERDPDAEVIHAEELLEKSAREFENENYGGSLYLASQAKNLLQVGLRRLSAGSRPVRPGEVLFASPLPLEVVRRGNLREGPGLEFKVLFKLEQGIPLVGHAYKGQWVRVRDEDGRAGWIFHSLVGSRSERDR